MNITSAGLLAIGATIGAAITPIAWVVSHLGAILQAINKKMNYPRKFEKCRFAYTSFQKHLNALPGYRREESLLQIFCCLTVTDLCPPSPQLITRLENANVKRCYQDSGCTVYWLKVT